MASISLIEMVNQNYQLITRRTELFTSLQMGEGLTRQQGGRARTGTHRLGGGSADTIMSVPSNRNLSSE